ncbi:MAG: hypothetical protein H6727_12975 [Myxococcales bacterium]|nr:hypothetical protein [Myxococcales bacterium]
MKRILWFFCLFWLSLSPLAHANLQGDYLIDGPETNRELERLINTLPASRRPALRKLLLQDPNARFQMWIKIFPQNRFGMMIIRKQHAKPFMRQGTWSKVNSTQYRLLLESKKNTPREIICRTKGNIHSLVCQRMTRRKGNQTFHLRYLGNIDQLGEFYAYRSKMKWTPPARTRRGMSAPAQSQIPGMLKDISRLLPQAKGHVREVKTSNEVESIRLQAQRFNNQPLIKRTQNSASLMAGFGTYEVVPPSEEEIEREQNIQAFSDVLRGVSSGKTCMEEWYLSYKTYVCAERQKTGYRIWLEKAELYLFGNKIRNLTSSEKDALAWLIGAKYTLRNFLAGLQQEFDKIRAKAIEFVEKEKTKARGKVELWVVRFVSSTAFRTVLKEVLNLAGKSIAPKVAESILKWNVQTLSASARQSILQTARSAFSFSKGAISATKIDTLVSLTVGVGLQIGMVPVNVFLKCTPYANEAKYCCTQRAIAYEVGMLSYNVTAAIMSVLLDAIIVTPISLAGGAFVLKTLGIASGGTMAWVSPVATKLIAVALNLMISGMFAAGGLAWDQILTHSTVKKHITEMTGLIMKQIYEESKKSGIDWAGMPCIGPCATTALSQQQCSGLDMTGIDFKDLSRASTPPNMNAGRDVGRHGHPISALYASQRQHTENFSIGSDQRVQYIYPHGGRWNIDKNTFRSGGRVRDAVSAVFSPARRHAEVFFINQDSKLQYFFLVPGRGWKHDTASFSKGGGYTGPLSAVYSPSRRHAEVFVRGLDDYLRYLRPAGNRWLIDATTFRKGDRVEGAVSAIYATQRAHTEVFYAGFGGRLNYFFVDRGRWLVDNRTFRAHPVQGDISAVFNPKARHSEVFYRGRDGYLNRYYLSGAWRHDNQSWRKAGRVTGPISVVYDPIRQHPSGFFRGEDGYLCYFFYNTAQKRWNFDNYSFRGAGRVGNAISAAYSAKRRHPEVFFRGVDRKYRYYYVDRNGWHFTVLNP